jgi:tRNA modification GTPase
MARSPDTIAALATPAGTSAVAVIRISGNDTGRLGADVFGEFPPPRAVRRGNYRSRPGAVLDDVLFTFFREPNSFTGEDSLEISCHGNPLVAQLILEDLYARGCRPAHPGEFTRRAFLNGRMDLSQAEAVMDLVHARSERALAAAQRQLEGALGRQMQALIDGVLEDLPREDLEAVRSDLKGVLRDADRLLATRRYGDLLRAGIKTVIFGEPNAGKSSLLNRLVGRERAIVSAEPGTTRDFIEEPVAVGPHCLLLVDTAGLRPDPAPLEKLGMDKTFERVGDADILLMVVDATRASPLPPAGMRLEPARTIRVLNKSDLLAAPPRADPSARFETLAVSALTGAGIDELRRALIRRADSFQAAAGADSVAINARHAHALAQAKACLAAALEKLESAPQSELLASDLRGALDAFGEISGRVDNEQVLDRLFASFCIGK